MSDLKDSPLKEVSVISRTDPPVQCLAIRFRLPLLPYIVHCSVHKNDSIQSVLLQLSEFANVRFKYFILLATGQAIPSYAIQIRDINIKADTDALLFSVREPVPKFLRHSISAERSDQLARAHSWIRQHAKTLNTQILDMDELSDVLFFRTAWLLPHLADNNLLTLLRNKVGKHTIPFRNYHKYVQENQAAELFSLHVQKHLRAAPIHQSASVPILNETHETLTSFLQSLGFLPSRPQAERRSLAHSSYSSRRSQAQAQAQAQGNAARQSVMQPPPVPTVTRYQPLPAFLLARGDTARFSRSKYAYKHQRHSGRLLVSAVQLPDTMLNRMVFDDHSRRNGYVLALPCRPTIAEIVTLFITQRAPAGLPMHRRRAAQQFADGLLACVRPLAPLLMTAEEMGSQPGEYLRRYLAAGRNPSQILGAVHLLRMMVRLPRVLVTSPWHHPLRPHLLHAQLVELGEFLDLVEPQIFSSPYELIRKTETETEDTCPISK
eukprot:gnl/Dysnectes_brevis/4220_a5580_447.p1 GENE.gnl/Dysnectes_brevis/4220_a5580_447~~gnl/Dysnectes_brevis/4220_a5580_447.p1  ORF type:complete len:492 (-),score=106.16 gnl/Dysnectes_brevis/4220_a5580_447:15-1490(-)